MSQHCVAETCHLISWFPTKGSKAIGFWSTFQSSKAAFVSNSKAFHIGNCWDLESFGGRAIAWIHMNPIKSEDLHNLPSPRVSWFTRGDLIMARTTSLSGAFNSCAGPSDRLTIKDLNEDTRSIINRGWVTVDITLIFFNNMWSILANIFQPSHIYSYYPFLFISGGPLIGHSPFFSGQPPSCTGRPVKAAVPAGLALQSARMKTICWRLLTLALTIHHQHITMSHYMI